MEPTSRATGATAPPPEEPPVVRSKVQTSTDETSIDPSKSKKKKSKKKKAIPVPTALETAGMVTASPSIEENTAETEQNKKLYRIPISQLLGNESISKERVEKLFPQRSTSTESSLVTSIKLQELQLHEARKILDEQESSITQSSSKSSVTTTHQKEKTETEKELGQKTTNPQQKKKQTVKVKPSTHLKIARTFTQEITLEKLQKLCLISKNLELARPVLLELYSSKDKLQTESANRLRKKRLHKVLEKGGLTDLFYNLKDALASQAENDTEKEILQHLGEILEPFKTIGTLDDVEKSLLRFDDNSLVACKNLVLFIPKLPNFILRSSNYLNLLQCNNVIKTKVSSNYEEIISLKTDIKQFNVMLHHFQSKLIQCQQKLSTHLNSDFSSLDSNQLNIENLTLNAIFAGTRIILLDQQFKRFMQLLGSDAFTEQLMPIVTILPREKDAIETSLNSNDPEIFCNILTKIDTVNLRLEFILANIKETINILEQT